MNTQSIAHFRNDGAVVDFVNHLLERGLIDQGTVRSFSSADASDSNSPLRRLWKFTDLSSNEFANEVAAFFGLGRLTLLELAELRSRADRFAPRFLREASLLPFERDGGTVAVAAGDPADTQALQAAEIVFGAPVEILSRFFRRYRDRFGRSA